MMQKGDIDVLDSRYELAFLVFLGMIEKLPPGLMDTALIEYCLEKDYIEESWCGVYSLTEDGHKEITDRIGFYGENLANIDCVAAGDRMAEERLKILMAPHIEKEYQEILHDEKRDAQIQWEELDTYKLRLNVTNHRIKALETLIKEDNSEAGKLLKPQQIREVKELKEEANHLDKTLRELLEELSGGSLEAPSEEAPSEQPVK